MPYKSMKDVNPAVKGIDPPVTLAQANLIASWADSIKQRRGDVNPWAVAISLFKRKHHTEKGKWVKDKASKTHSAAADEFLDLIEGLEEVGLQIVRHFPPIGQPFYPYDDVPPSIAGEPAYVVDLFAELPQVDGKPDFSQPFRILPAGTIHRYGKRTVTVDDIEQFADNWLHRAARGIRRSRVVIDAEHESGGIGLYTDIFSKEADGLWAKIALSKNGRKLLESRDFHFFSPSVAWESKDRVTGNVINNQIVGGALTNFPIFGDDTALPTMGYSEAALQRLRKLYPGTDLKYLFQQKGDDMTVKFTPEDRTLLDQAKEFFANLKKKGGDPVPDKKPKDPVKITELSVEAFSTLQSEVVGLKTTVETLNTERDVLKTQVTDGQTKLAAETYARVLQEMRQLAETFTHLALPVELPKDAAKGTLTAQEHLAWLQEADVTDGQPHWKFFNEVFRAANASLAEAAQFTELGALSGEQLSEDEALNRKAIQYATEHKVDYVIALQAVLGGAEPTKAA